MGVKIVTDGSEDVDEAVANKFISGDGVKTQIEINYAHIRYNGSTWEVVAADDNCDIETGDLTGEFTTNNELQITLAGYTNLPCVLVSPVDSDTSHYVKADVSSNTLITVSFFDGADLNTRIGTEATDMDFFILVIGV